MGLEGGKGWLEGAANIITHGEDLLKSDFLLGEEI